MFNQKKYSDYINILKFIVLLEIIISILITILIVLLCKNIIITLLITSIIYIIEIIFYLKMNIKVQEMQLKYDIYNYIKNRGTP